MKYDLIIIGLGPAGQKMALEAHKLQKKVLVFEKNKVGGTCLNVGCIPTKSIMHSSSTKSWEECLLKQGEIVSKFNKAVEKDFANKGIEIIFDEAKLDADNLKVTCKGKEYCAKDIVIATGSKPFEIKGLEFDKKNILSSDDIFNMNELPKSLAIIGSGAIGIEWTRIFHNLGVKVTVVEAMEHLLPSMDVDISKRIERIFKINKIDFFTNVSAKSFKEGVLTLSDERKIEVQKVLVGVGRQKNIPKNITVNDDFTTNYKNVYGIGDIAPYPMLAHSAAYQAEVLIDKLYKNKSKQEKPLIPSVIYGNPEIASVGLREQDINNCNGKYEIYSMPVLTLPKAWCDENTEGFIKIITKNNKIEGAHIVSNEASSLIGIILVCMKAKMNVEQFREIIFPHPTLSEGLNNVFEFKK